MEVTFVWSGVAAELGVRDTFTSLSPPVSELYSVLLRNVFEAKLRINPFQQTWCQSLGVC